MIKLLLKHTIGEMAINALFEKIQTNFPKSQKLEFHVGQKINEIVHTLYVQELNGDVTAYSEILHGCEVTDVIGGLSPRIRVRTNYLMRRIDLSTKKHQMIFVATKHMMCIRNIDSVVFE